VCSWAKYLIRLSVGLLLTALPLTAQGAYATDDMPDAPSAVAQAAQQAQATGTITGTVEDQSGAVSVGAKVELTVEGQGQPQQLETGVNGQFTFSHVPPGTFHLKVSATGFNDQEITGDLDPGQFYITPLIALAVSGGATEVSVTLTPVEVAQAELKEELQQRVFGFIPNFYVTYNGDAQPLSSKQKFHLAWKSSIDPVTIAGAAFLAGLEQASDDFSGYGQGMAGYGKRFGASYADIFAGTFIGSAILPSVLKQDPRYYYKGTGSTKSRIAYALANSVMCKGDNKKWQVNYSSIVGSFATGGISYLYYPSSDRSAGLLVQNAMLRIAESSFTGVFQEFVLHKLTRVPQHSRQQ